MSLDKSNPRIQLTRGRKAGDLLTVKGARTENAGCCFRRTRTRKGDDPAVRQCLLEFLEASAGDLGFRQIQIVEVNQPFEMLQPGVRDISVPQDQVVKVR